MLSNAIAGDCENEEEAERLQVLRTTSSLLLVPEKLDHSDQSNLGDCSCRVD